MKRVAIVMGSQSDGPTMKHAADMLNKFGIEYHAEVVSAHRTPHLLQEFSETAADKGVAVGTLAIGEAGAANAGLLAAQIIGLNDSEVIEKVKAFRLEQTQDVLNNHKLDF